MILLTFIKNLLKRKLFRFLIVIIVIYKLIFNSYAGEFLIKKGFAAASTGTILLDVKRFSLFYGIIINDILISSGKDFESKPVLKIERLAVAYNLPLLFTGRLKLTEISLTKPEAHIWQRNGKWNAEALFITGEEKKEEKKEEPSESSNELSLPIPVSAYLNFFIHDLKVEIEAEKGDKYFYAFLDNFSFYFLLNTKRFSKIPFSPKAISIIDELNIQLNPTNDIQISMKDNTTSIKTDLKLSLLLNNNNSGPVPSLSSSLNIGSDHIPIKMKSGNISPFSFQIAYDLNYIPEEDKVELKNLLVAFAKNKLLEAKGEIKEALKDNPEIHFEVIESYIDLDNIERITDTVPIIPPMNLSGHFSLKPLNVNGRLNQLKIDSEIKGKNIIVELFGAIHNMPIIDLDMVAILDLLTKEVSSDSNILPILTKLELHNLEGQYNGIVMKIKGEISPKEKVDLKLDLDKLVIEKFVPNLLGKAHLFIKVTGNKLSLLAVDLKANLQGLRYKLGRGISGINQVELSLKTAIDLKKDFQLETLKVEPLTLIVQNENKKEIAAKIASSLDLDMRNGTIARLDKLKVDVNVTYLIPTVPVALRGTIAGLRNSLGNQLTLTGKVDYKEDNRKKRIQLGLHASLPALELTDLSVGSLIEIAKDEKETLTIDNITLSAFESKFRGLFKGNFYKPRTANPPLGEYAGELNGNLTLESDIYRYVLKGTSFKGDLDIDINVKDHLIKGALRSSDSSIQYKTSECPGKGCQTYEVNGLKMNIPFLHDINDKTTENLLDGNKTNFVKTYGQDAPSNITIKSVSGTHPSLENAKLDFVKSEGANPGFSARIDYTENYLTIDNMKIYSMNGLIYGKDILFNIGNGDPEKIEYTAVLQVRDIDLGEMLPKEMRKKIDDGKIKLDMNISGKNLTDPIANLDLFFSTFYVGEDFGKSAIRIVSPENWMTDRIINSYRVDKIEVELTKGLVYAVIKFQKSVFNTLVFNVENDMISQERIPLASFLKRSEKELSTYK